MESATKPALLLDLNLLSSNNYLSSDGTCCSLVSVVEPPIASHSKEQDNLSFTSTSSLALSSSSSSNCSTSTSPSSQSPPSSLCFKLREEEEEEEKNDEENDILLGQISTSTSRSHFFSQFSSRNKIKRNKSLSFINLGPKITLAKKFSFSSKQHQLELQQEEEKQRQQTKTEESRATTTTTITATVTRLSNKSKSMNRLLEVPLASSVKMISWFKEFKSRKTNSSKKLNDSSVVSNDENVSPIPVSLEHTTVDSTSSTSSIELTNETMNNLNISSNSSSSSDCNSSNTINNCNNCDKNRSDDFETKNEAPANFKNIKENNNNNNNDNNSNNTSIETNLLVQNSRPLNTKPTKTWSPVSFSSSSSASTSPSSISYLLPSYSFASPRSNNSNSFGGYYRSNSQIKTTTTIRTTPNSPRTTNYQPRPRFDPRSVQKLVLEWCQFHTKDYKNVNITNFSSSWSDGLAFCALIHSFIPNSFDYSRLESNNRYENFELAFDIALKQANISPLLEVDDMIRMGNRPDDRCVYTYVSTIYSRFKSLKPMEKAK